MLKKIFDPTNVFFHFCGKLADLLMLSVLWCICCIPIVTIGSATASLYNSASKCVRKGLNRPYVRFRDCMKENFKSGIPVSILITLILFLFSYEFISLWNWALSGSQIAYVFLIAIGICSFIPLSYVIWITALFSRYEFGFQQLVITALQFVFAHLFSSLIMGVLTAVCIFLCYILVFPLTILPCLLAVVNSIFVEKAFSKH